MQVIGILIAIILLTALVLMVEVDEHEQEEMRQGLLHRADTVHRASDWHLWQGESANSMQD